MAGLYQRFYASRRDADAALVVLDLFGDTNDHLHLMFFLHPTEGSGFSQGDAPAGLKPYNGTKAIRTLLILLVKERFAADVVK